MLAALFKNSWNISFNVFLAVCLTLPYSNNVPAEFFEFTDIPFIPFFISLQFFGPETDIAFRQMSSVFTVMSVPETTMDQDTGLVFG